MRYLSLRAFTQKKLWEISPSEGAFFPMATEEKIRLAATPYIGVCKISNVRDRVVPPQWRAEINNATVYSPSFAVTSGRTLWQQEEVSALPLVSAGYSNSFQSSSGFRKILAGNQPDKFHIYTRLKPFKTIREAALISHRTSFNYFHFTYECVPKILALKAIDPEAKIPVIFDDRVQDSIKQVVLSVLEPKRKIIMLPANVTLKVQRLHVFSTPSHMPDDPLMQPERAALSPTQIQAVANALRPSEPSAFPAAFYWVSRKHYAAKHRSYGYQVRDVKNGDELMALGQKASIHLLHPEGQSWHSQRDYFSSAHGMVMVAGGAAGNLVFCKPGTRVVMLCKNEGVNPGLFNIITSALGLQVLWVLGEPDSSDAHSNFSINPADMPRAIDWLKTGKSDFDGFLTMV